MKKLILCGVAMLYMAMAATFAQPATFKVQGHERPDLVHPKTDVQAVSAYETATEETAFSFDDILFWVGEGTNRAALVVDWYDEELDHALVWGYRWNGEATGYDMISAIAAADSRFTLLTHLTNLGNTIAGLGYNTHSPYETEFLYTPAEGEPGSYKPVNGIVTTSAYHYDDWTCSDANALWRAGWYTQGYWSYQVKDVLTEEFSYSNWGASSRKLTDGCMDGWSFASLNTTRGSLPRMPYEAVTAAAEPTDANAYWGQMYKNPEHQSIVDLPLAMAENQLSVKWEYPFAGYSGQPIVVGDYMYNTTGKKIIKISLHDGSLVAEHDMIGSIGFFSMIAYGDGKIFVTLGGGVNQAFDAVTLKPLWQSKVEVGGQQLCPIVYHDGYLYTGTWNGGSPATGVFYCLSTADDDPEVEDEIKTPVWQSANTGFYWSGGSIVGDCIFVGGDDGVMRSYNRLTGAVVDEWVVAPDVAGSTIRSGTSYDEKTQRLFFTGKEARKIYSVKINPDGTFADASKLATDIAGQATTTPTVYNGRVYATSGTMTSGGGFDVFDAQTLEKIYTVDMGGISQSTPVVNTAFATEENGHEVYIYVCLNNAQGSLVCLRDFEGNTEPIIQYKWDAPKIQWCTHSMVMDQYGMMYYKNDSKGFWALGSKGVSLNQPTAKIKIGEELALHPRVVTTNANKNVSWASTNPEVATVDALGVVKGLAAGKTNIVVEMEEGAFTDMCEVSVYAPLTGITLAQSQVEMNVGDEEALTITIAPAGSQEDLVWASSNETIATVSETGVVTAVAPGEAVITVSTKDGRLTQTCRVKAVPVAVTGVNIVAMGATVGKNGLQLTATVLPQNATNKNVSWTSSDETIATVSETGKVTAVMPGNATITVTTEEGSFTASQAVTVDIVPVTGVSLNQNTLALVYNGSNARLTATVTPANASINTVTFESTDETVATVTSPYGWVYPQGVGTAKVIVRTVNGNFADTCVVTVEDVHVAGISLNLDTLRIEDGKNKSLTVTFTPAAVSNKTITWFSTDEAVATVSATYNGASVKPVGNGEALIIGQSEDGGFADTCVVLVSNLVVTPVTGVVISNKTLALTLGGSGRMLTAKVLPDTATRKDITWESTDEAVAIVSAMGTVTAKAGGEAKIIVKTVDGGFADTCTVTVRVPVTGVTLNKTAEELTVGDELALLATVMPENATNKACTWASSDAEVASVSETGVVTALGVGEATVTVTTEEGNFTATCKLTVKAASVPDDPTVAVTGVTLDKTAAELTVGGEALQLTATVAPADATDKTVAWTSSNEAVATVSESGLVTAVAAGEADITVTTTDGGFTAICKVTVKAASEPGDPTIAVTGVTLDKTAAELTVGGEALQLTATVAPADATDKTVAWTSSNEAVATVSATGLVTAVAAGEADITVTTTDGGFTAICKVTVKADTTANEAALQAILTSVYPNPTAETVYVEVAEPAWLEVFALNGRMVLRREIGAGVQTVTLEKSGVYIIKVSSGDRVSVQRVVRR